MRVALALPLESERTLESSAAYHGHQVVAVCSGGDELAVRLAQLPVDAAIVMASPEYLTRSLVESADILGVRLWVVADGSEALRHAERVGIIDAVDGPARWELLLPGAPATETGETAGTVAVGEPAESAAASSPRRQGTIIAVWGPHGAPGRTSLAIALAAEFASCGNRVVLADADTHAASIAPALGLLDEAPGFAAACRLAGLGGLDENQFERLARPHQVSRSPFRVLTGIARSSRWPELSADRVAGVLAAARSGCDVLVVDLAASLETDEALMGEVDAPRRNAVTLEVLRSADRVVAVAAADPVGIARFLRVQSELGEQVEQARLVTVVNKLRASAIGVNPAGQLRQTFSRLGGIDDLVFVPWDPGAFDAALLGGRSLVDAAPRSAVRGAVRELAARLVPTSAVRGVPRRRGRRLA